MTDTCSADIALSSKTKSLSVTKHTNVTVTTSDMREILADTVLEIYMMTGLNFMKVTCAEKYINMAST
jgi:hypothetical protein